VKDINQSIPFLDFFSFLSFLEFEFELAGLGIRSDLSSFSLLAPLLIVVTISLSFFIF